MRQVFRSAVLRGSVVCLAAVFVLGALVLLAVARPKNPPAVVVLQKPYAYPLLWRDRLPSLLPQTRAWTWLWRLQDFVLGKRKPVEVFGEVVTVTYPTAVTLSGLVPVKSAFSNETGLQCWILNTNELAKIREALKRVPEGESTSRPRFSTGDGIVSQLSQQQLRSSRGSNLLAQLTFTCFARVRGNGTDLIVGLLASEKVTTNTGASPTESVAVMNTNFDCTVRLQIPKGSGVFMLLPGCSSSKKEQAAVTVEPKQK